jgi:2-dehydropantoate 2-reductase
MEIISSTEQEAVGKIGELGAMLESEAPDHRWSTLQDLERGRYLEVEETLGYVVAEARREGIPVPTVETCYLLINGINRIQQSQPRP